VEFNALVFSTSSFLLLFIVVSQAARGRRERSMGDNDLSN